MATNKSPLAEIWCASNYDNSRRGYLVTELENIDRPLAFIDFVKGSAADGFEVARKICIFHRQEPWRAAIGIEGISVIDLTAYGRKGSAVPMPGFVYGLTCVPADDQGNPMVGAENREPRPWCRFMVDALSKGGSVEAPTSIDNDRLQCDLIHTQWNLWKLAQHNTPDHPIVSRLKPSEDDIPDEIGPDLIQSTEAAIAAFWALPPDEQRKVLGGWKPCAEPGDRQQIVRETTCGEIYRVLEFLAGPNGTVDTIQSHALSESSLPVLVRINEGTTKADAMVSLFNVLRMIANDYNEALIDDVPGTDSMTSDTFGKLFEE